MPQISVIVPVYKVEQYLRRCVESILFQSYADFELILVDDGSPDSCGSICDEYAQRDSRIQVIHQKNGGLSAARNAGIDWAFANSNSQWLTFIDSDDWIHPDYLHTLLYAATSTNLPVSVCGFARTSGEEPVILPEQFKPKTWNSEDFFIQHNVNAIVAWGKLYKKELFRKIRYPVGKIHEDEFTTYKLLFATEKVAVVEAPLYFYFQNESSIMGASWSPKRLDALTAFRERLFFLKSKKLLKAYRWHVAHYWLHVESYTNHLAKLPQDVSQAYAAFIKKHLRTGLHHAKKMKLITFHGNEHLYEKAYPFAMRLYWYWKVLCNKISKRR